MSGIALIGLSMDRYFFDLRNDGALVVDQYGFEISDSEAMQQQATLLLLELNRDQILSNKSGAIAVEVRNRNGAVMKAHLAFDFPRTGEVGARPDHSLGLRAV